MLSQFRLLDKTRLDQREFNTVDLSTGQRKRLALIVSLLEKRPILLLDEWAADQDPEFRRKFYFDLLPELHRAGATVVAVSHDDRYLDESTYLLAGYVWMKAVSSSNLRWRTVDEGVSHLW